MRARASSGAFLSPCRVLAGDAALVPGIPPFPEASFFLPLTHTHARAAAAAAKNALSGVCYRIARRYVGLNDLKQHNHSIRRNFPVLGHLRYLLESIRPEIQQYFIEGDNEETPFSREMRAVVYQRAKVTGPPPSLSRG